MKIQALFSSKDKSKNIKMSSAANFVWRFKCLIPRSALSILACDISKYAPKMVILLL